MTLRIHLLAVSAACGLGGIAGCGSRSGSATAPSVMAELAASRQPAAAAAFIKPLADTHVLVDIRFNAGPTDRSLHGPYPYLANTSVTARELTAQTPVNPDWNVTDGYVYLLTDPTLTVVQGVKESGEAEPASGRPRLARTNRVKISTPNCKVIVWVLATAEGTTRERVFHCVDDRPGADGEITVTTQRATIKSVKVPEGQYVDITESGEGSLDLSQPIAIPQQTPNPVTSVERFLKYVDLKQQQAGLGAPPW